MVAQQDSDGVIPEVLPPQSVSVSPDTWRAGADALRRNQLGPLAAMCLDALAPLALVASQLLYAGGPFLGPGVIRWAKVLESEQSMSALSRYLTNGDADRPHTPQADRD